MNAYTGWRIFAAAVFVIPTLLPRGTEYSLRCTLAAGFALFVGLYAYVDGQNALLKDELRKRTP